MNMNKNEIKEQVRKTIMSTHALIENIKKEKNYKRMDYNARIVDICSNDEVLVSIRLEMPANVVKIIMKDKAYKCELKSGDLILHLTELIEGIIQFFGDEKNISLRWLGE